MAANLELDDRPLILELLRSSEHSGRIGISALGLQNFQAIAGPAFIPLAPITMLYGPNSGGKSAIGDAMTFLARSKSSDARPLRENITKRMLDRWSNFNRFSPGRNTQSYVRQPSSVGLWVVAGAGESFNWFAMNTGNVVSDLDILAPSHSLFYGQHFAVRWLMDHDGHNLAVPTQTPQFAIWVGSESINPLLEISNEPWNESDPTAATLRLNCAHPLFPTLDELWIDAARDEGSLRHVLTADQSIDRKDWLELKEFEWDDYRPALFDLAGPGSDFDKFEAAPYLFFADLIADCMKVISSMCNSEVVPPIRRVPSRAESTFTLLPLRANPELRKMIVVEECKTIDPWEQLARDAADLEHVTDGDVGVVNYVNDLIRNESALGIGYKLQATCYRFGPGASRRKKFDRNDPPDDIACMVHLNLLDEQNNEVEIEDVGTGVSQLIPVLVALFGQSNLVVHQPELHLHPRLQSVLGDIFLMRRLRTSAHTIVESHSEHLLLRILRRIRETADSIYANPPCQVRADEVVIHYFDKGDDGITVIKTLRIDGRGEFLDRWPHGFFTERDEDLDAFAV